MPPPCSWRVSNREPSWSSTATLTASGRRVRTTQVPSPAGCVPSTAYGSCDQPSTMARRSSPLTSALTPIDGEAGGVVAVGSAATEPPEDGADSGGTWADFFAGAPFPRGGFFAPGLFPP